MSAPPHDATVTLHSWSDGDSHAPSDARRALQAALTEMNIIGEPADDVTLAVGELIANAVEHATGPYTLNLRRAGGDVLCEVHDTSQCLPRLRVTQPLGELFAPCEEGRGGGLDAISEILAERGRGLRIVDELSGGCWGARQTDSGKCCWMAIPCYP
ncbi:ATP-binding protein [Streptomyces sp. NBC_00006]|uniref:ATP-binding protein n=1 Tax=unclassified Streptomyces TaxID=2593676 RepID=UPI00224E10BE|nr:MULTISPECIES: ATP-binding protein [unclassified Streptomyces]MCX5535737.1 ATP-binding protein [Streptomyces sp. NBC_00006]